MEFSMFLTVRHSHIRYTGSVWRKEFNFKIIMQNFTGLSYDHGLNTLKNRTHLEVDCFSYKMATKNRRFLTTSTKNQPLSERTCSCRVPFGCGSLIARRIHSNDHKVNLTSQALLWRTRHTPAISTDHYSGENTIKVTFAEVYFCQRKKFWIFPWKSLQIQIKCKAFSIPTMPFFWSSLFPPFPTPEKIPVCEQYLIGVRYVGYFSHLTSRKLTHTLPCLRP